MASSDGGAPVIIKRKKVVGGGGHHGGAWKVAYADFVTAMMAFFLLMWLLNATTEKQRKGLADYFSPTIPIHRVSSGSANPFGGDSVYSEEELMRDGRGGSDRTTSDSRNSRGDTGLAEAAQDAETEALKTIEEELNGRGGESMVTEEALKHIVTRVTDEGLIIELFATEEAALFEDGTDEPTLLMRELTGMIARVTGKVRNGFAIDGHVRANPVVRAENPVWELSAAQASRTRRLMEDAGTASQRMMRVTGHADRQAADVDRMAKRNDRIEITLLRSDKKRK